MSEHQFLLTYSVNTCFPNLNDDVIKSDKVRAEIANISYWEKLQEVETTFKGSFDLPNYASENEKRKESEKQVREKFISILKKNKAISLDVNIQCCMMVNGAGEAFEFKVEHC